VSRVGLAPLPLKGCDPADLPAAYEPYRRPDPYEPLWRRLTAKPRAAFEMDPIAWGAFPGSDPEEDPTSEAAELRGG